METDHSKLFLLRQKIFHLILISRPVLWINTIGPAFMALWLTGDLWRPEFAVWLLWLSLPFNLLIYGINDIFDREIDAHSVRKGGLQGAKIQSVDVPWIFGAVVVLNLPILLWFYWRFPLSANLWAWAYSGLFIAYSAPPFRFKARPLIDSFSNAAYALPLAFIPAAVESSINGFALIGLCFWCVAKHCFDAIQDIHDDEAHGLKTTPIYLGVKLSLLFCGTFWMISSICFATLSPSFAVVNGGYAAWLIYRVAKNPSSATARKAYSLSIAFPYIVGGIAGVSLALALVTEHWPK